MVIMGKVPRQLSVMTVAALIAVSGCAARASRLESRFVKPGEPKVKLDADVAPEPPSLQDFMRKVRIAAGQGQAEVEPPSDD